MAVRPTKKKLISLIVVIAVLIGAGTTYRLTTADPAPLPTSTTDTSDINTVTHNFFDAPFSGNELYESGFIQPPENPWTINLTFTPLNGTSTITVLSANGSILDLHHCGSVAGSCSFSEPFSQPVKVMIYASSWTVSIQ